MFRTISGPVPAWESLLPPELLRLPEELARVDALATAPMAPTAMTGLFIRSHLISCHFQG